MENRKCACVYSTRRHPANCHFAWPLDALASRYSAMYFASCSTSVKESVPGDAPVRDNKGILITARYTVADGLAHPRDGRAGIETEQALARKNPQSQPGSR